MVALALIGIMMVEFFPKMVRSATYVWTQTTWSSQTANTTGHPAPGNWTEYSANTGNVATGMDLTLPSVGVVVTQTPPTFSN